MSVDVSVRGLIKGYWDGTERINVLQQLDLEVASGEMVAIVGPSGSGKSTLLHVLGALDRPDEGEVHVADLDLGRLDRAEQAEFRRRNLGFIFQFHELLPDFTLLENVMMPARISGWATERATRRGRELLAEVDLAGQEHRFPNQLSGGERQRVALCRALCLEPPLLLADEPTGNLDPESGERMFDLLLDLRQAHGTTSIVVTHNPAIAQRCGRILSLDRGRLHDWQDNQSGLQRE